MNGILLVCECILSSYCTPRWWGHLNRTYCNQICLNFVHSLVVGMLKRGFHAHIYLLAPACSHLHPKAPCETLNCTI